MSCEKKRDRIQWHPAFYAATQLDYEEDLRDNGIVVVTKQLFVGKQHIPWKDVEFYLNSVVGTEIIVEENGDKITIPPDFPNEYIGSEYSKRLRGSLAKVKANASQVIVNMVIKATNRRYVENKSIKHAKDAAKGWYRYDVAFLMAVRGENEKETRYNAYKGTIVVRIRNNGLFLYDLINIKKEARTPPRQ